MIKLEELEKEVAICLWRLALRGLMFGRRGVC